MEQQVENYRDPRISAVTKFIELLNDIGMTIIKIDDVYFYLTGEFVPADSEIPYTTIVGSNISEKVLNAIDVAASSNLAEIKTRLQQEIFAMKSYRREFHKDLIWKKFVANGSK